MKSRKAQGYNNYGKGERFQKEMAEAWFNVPNAWRMRIRDGGNGDRPADEIVLLDNFRLLCELKCTAHQNFNITKMLRSNQINALLAFSRCNIYNLGVVIINFETKHECYLVHIHNLIKWVEDNGKLSIKRDNFLNKDIKNIKVEKKNDRWDLKKINDFIGELK